MQKNVVLEWTDERYSIGIPEIDNQHKVIVAKINQLYACMQQGVTKQNLATLFDELFEYTKYHFETEEKYFNRLSNQNLTLHKLQHKHFLEQLKFFKRSDSKLKITTERLYYFLIDWLTEHILIEDKKLTMSIPAYVESSH